MSADPENTREPKRRRRSHPAEVTADRLRYSLDKWPEAFDGHERDAIGLLIHRFEQIAEGR